MNFYGACRTSLAGGVSPLVVGGSCRTGLTLNVEVRSCLRGLKEMSVHRGVITLRFSVCSRV